jgi:hypothetical protein
MVVGWAIQIAVVLDVPILRIDGQRELGGAGEQHGRTPYTVSEDAFAGDSATIP